MGAVQGVRRGGVDAAVERLNRHPDVVLGECGQDQQGKACGSQPDLPTGHRPDDHTEVPAGNQGRDQRA